MPKRQSAYVVAASKEDEAICVKKAREGVLRKMKTGVERAAYKKRVLTKKGYRFRRVKAGVYRLKRSEWLRFLWAVHCALDRGTYLDHSRFAKGYYRREVKGRGLTQAQIEQVAARIAARFR